jgi:hypothetical protein
LKIHAKGVSQFFLVPVKYVQQKRHSVPATYTVSTDTLSWGAARAACKKQSADLVSIETEQENKCVKEKIQLAGMKYSVLNVSLTIEMKILFSGKSASIVLTALNKMGLKEYSQWLSGDKITFSGWNAGEPAQLSTENCGAFQLVDFIAICMLSVLLRCFLEMGSGSTRHAWTPAPTSANRQRHRMCAKVAFVFFSFCCKLIKSILQNTISRFQQKKYCRIRKYWKGY